jgi:hypothetical protein
MNQQPEHQQLKKLNKLKVYIENIDIKAFNTEDEKNELNNILLKIKFLNKLEYNFQNEKLKKVLLIIDLLINELIINLHKKKDEPEDQYNKIFINTYIIKTKNQKKKDKQKERQRQKKEQEAKEQEETKNKPIII